MQAFGQVSNRACVRIMRSSVHRSRIYSNLQRTSTAPCRNLWGEDRGTKWHSVKQSIHTHDAHDVNKTVQNLKSQVSDVG